MTAVLHTRSICLVVVAVLAVIGACGVQFVTPNRPPANIPSALLYSRPKETFWVVCAAESSGQKCDFYNIDGRSIAFRCSYNLTVPPTQETFSHSWLGGSRELKLDNGLTIACLAREEAPADR